MTNLLPAYKGVEIEWRPVEAHPRPENSHPHTDLCIQAFYIAEELGADLNALHTALFKAVVLEGRDVEKGEVLADILKGIIESEKLLALLKNGKFAPRVSENNTLAYDKNEVWYLPAFRVPGSGAPRLDAKGGIGVSSEEIKGFLESLVLQ